MDRIDKIFSWFFRLCKKTLKKPSFIVILCSLPLLAIGVSKMAEADGGMLSVAVVTQDNGDAVAQALTDSLFQHKSIIHYKQADSEEEAVRLVEEGEADAAWLIPANLQTKIEEYVEHGMNKDSSLVTVIEKEDNVALHLTREILFGKLYEPLAYEIYKQYVCNELLEGTSLTEKELKEAYYRMDVEENFFKFSYLNGETQELENGYLLLPLRGLLALFVLLSGLAFSMYYMKEEEQGCFIWTKMESGVIRRWLYHVPEMLLTGLIVLSALYLAGLFETPGKEVALLALYSIMVIGFSDVLRRLCRKITIMGVLLPVIILLSMVLTPMFLRVEGLTFIKALLPITYYFDALHESSGVIRMLAFIVIVYILDVVLYPNYKKEKREV